MRAALPPPRPSLFAPGVLVAIVVAAPWPFGSVSPAATLALIAAGLLAAAAAFAIGAWRGGLVLPAAPSIALAGFVALGLAQLVPLPAGIHARVAPGSFAAWHPPVQAAAAVLGTGPHPLSIDPATTLRASALVAALGLLASLSAPALAEGRTARRALWPPAICGFALSVYAIWARARFGTLLYGTWAVPTVSPFGPFVNKNHFAGWAAMGALLAAGLAAGLAAEAGARGRDWTAGRRSGAVVLALVSALAMALAAVASLSRGGAVALSAGALALAALLLLPASPRGRRASWSALLIGAALAATVLALAPPAAHERLRTLSGVSFRLETWRDAARLVARSPLLGHGLGAFHDAFPPEKRSHGFVRVEHAENDYLEVAAEGGVAGLALALLGLALLLQAVVRPQQASPPVLARGIRQGAAAALVAIVVHSAFDFELRIPSNAALVALAAALAASGSRTRVLGSLGCAAVSLGAALLLWGTVARGLAPWPAAWEEAGLARSAAASEVRLLRLQRTEAALVATLRMRPGCAECWLMLAGTRASLGEGSSAAFLARHAVRLDPERTELRAAAAGLVPDRVSSR